MTHLLPKHLYPFEGRWFDRGAGIRMHYLDEGSANADPVVMVHGNPSWSIYYRSLVGSLSDRYRCIVPDHVGMGLSDKPDDNAYSYTLQQRIDDLDALLAHLRLGSRVTLVVHDWGGAIGLGWAVRHPEAIARIVVMNTGAFPMPRAKTFPLALAVTRTPVGAVLVRGGNAFARAATHVCVKQPMSAELRSAYTAPYDSWAHRIATLRFVQDIPLRPRDPSYMTLQRVADGLAQFLSSPVLIGWGMQDFVFDHTFLDEWCRRWPHAEVRRFEDAGHYLLEDKAAEFGAAVRGFIDRAVPTGASPRV